MQPAERESPDRCWGKIAAGLGCVTVFLLVFNLLIVFGAFGTKPLGNDGDVHLEASGSVASSNVPPPSPPPSDVSISMGSGSSTSDGNSVWASLNFNQSNPWPALAELRSRRSDGSIDELLFRQLRARMFAANGDSETVPLASFADQQATDNCKLKLEPFPAGRKLTGVVLTVITGGPGRSKYMLEMVEHSWDALVRFLLVPQGIDFTFVLDSSTHSGTEQHVRELALQMHLDINQATTTRAPVPPVLGVPHGTELEVVSRHWVYQPDTSLWDDYQQSSSQPSINVVIRTQPMGFPAAALDLDLVRIKPGSNPPEYEVTRPIDPDFCQPDDAIAYIQGTRWYTYDMYMQPEAQQYDYLFKMDYDIFFYDYFPFNIMVDMNRRNAMFMHTVRFEHGECTCSVSTESMNAGFLNAYGGGQPGCSAGEADFDSRCDRYYTNFVGMRSEYFRSPEVLAYGRWMNEYPDGFFRHRWSDQAYFHKALGTFIGPNFRDVVVDYSQFRCSREHECWATLDDTECIERNTLFVHSKGFGQFDRLVKGKFRKSPHPTPPVADNERPFETSGQWYCKKRK